MSRRGRAEGRGAGMKPAPLAYARPASLAEALDLLAGEDARALAGGQSLVPALNLRLAAAGTLVDINRLPGLDHVRLGDRGLVIGALVRHAELEASPLVAEHAPLLAQAMPHVGHLAIRSRGTLGGSVALADPAAEIPACLVALDAVIRVTARDGAREVPAASFFRGIYTTDLRRGELVTEVVVPAAPGCRSRFFELARRHGDYALVAVAARARVAAGRLEDLRLVLAGVGVAPVRVARCEAALAGRRPDATALDEAGRVLAAELDPLSDVHASAALRRHLARVLVARAVAALVRLSGPMAA